MHHETRTGPGSTLWRSTDPRVAVVPADGCLDLVLLGDELLIAGPSTRWLHTRPAGTTPTVGLRLDPGVAGGLLRLDPAGLRDTLTPADQVLGRSRVAALRDTLRAAGTTRDPAPILGRAGLLPDPSDLGRLDQVIRHAARATPVTAAARELCTSERQLRRRMLAEFGYGYRTLTRVLRARRAVRLVRTGTPLAEAADRSGFSDQPHLSREFRVLVGASPGEVARDGTR